MIGKPGKVPGFGTSQLSILKILYYPSKLTFPSPCLGVSVVNNPGYPVAVCSAQTLRRFSTSQPAPAPAAA